MKYLLLGKYGQVGSELLKRFAPQTTVIGIDRDDFNLASADDVRRVVREVHPDVIINAAAYTAVDAAETNRELAFALNAQGPEVLAQEAKQCGAVLVHYSTDYVFDGTKPEPYSETDTPNPQNVYGASKLAGDLAIRKYAGKYLIFRTSWVYSAGGKNFVKAMLRLFQERPELKIVHDQVGGPTAAHTVAEATLKALGQMTAKAADRVSGVYNLTCGGKCSWYEFARKINDIARQQDESRFGGVKLLPITSAEYATPAKRPFNSVLSNEKVASVFGLRMPEWKTALNAVMKEMRIVEN